MDPMPRKTSLARGWGDNPNGPDAEGAAMGKGRSLAKAKIPQAAFSFWPARFGGSRSMVVCVPSHAGPIQ